MEQAEIGIFGGTGIYDSGLLKESKEVIVDTPFGKTSDSITVGIFKGKKVAFIDRKSTRLNSSHIQKSRMPSSA